MDDTFVIPELEFVFTVTFTVGAGVFKEAPAPPGALPPAAAPAEAPRLTAEPMLAAAESAAAALPDCPFTTKAVDVAVLATVLNAPITPVLFAA